MVAGSIKGFTPYAAIDDLFQCLGLFKKHVDENNGKVCLYEMYEPSGNDGPNPLTSNPIKSMPAELISSLIEESFKEIMSLGGFLKTNNVTVFPGFSYYLEMPSIAGVGIPDVGFNISSQSVPIPSGINWPPPALSKGLTGIKDYIENQMCVALPYRETFNKSMENEDKIKSLIEDMAHFAGIPGNMEKSAKDKAVKEDFRACLYNWIYENDLQELNFDNPIDIVRSFIKYAAREELMEGGVTYQSTGADYAEFLPKLNPNEKMLFGQIVGVHGGKITKNTDGAEQIMAISTKPVVVGNLPPEGKEYQYATVGFMGQLPVLVRGKVKSGDYIIASGNDDGIGIAVSPQHIQLSDLPVVLGRAWSESDDDLSISLINVVIGVKSNEWVEILSRHSNKIHVLERDVDKLKQDIADILAILQQHSSLK